MAGAQTPCLQSWVLLGLKFLKKALKVHFKYLLKLLIRNSNIPEVVLLDRSSST